MLKTEISLTTSCSLISIFPLISIFAYNGGQFKSPLQSFHLYLSYGLDQNLFHHSHRYEK